MTIKAYIHTTSKRAEIETLLDSLIPPMGSSLCGQSRATFPWSRVSPPTPPHALGPSSRPFMMACPPPPSFKTTASSTGWTFSSPTALPMGTFPQYALVLFWLYLPAFVVLSAASWPFPIPPPWPSNGILYVGHMLGMFEMLSLIWSVALLFTLLLYLHLPTTRQKCTPSGSLTIPCLPTPPPSPVVLPMAIDPLLLSKGFSPEATAASSPQPSRSLLAMLSPLTIPADSGLLPTIPPRAPVPQGTTLWIT
jgi:hypothetical protein